MYRKIFTFLFLFASLNIAQSIKVIKTEKLISGDMERLFFPKFSPNGSYIALTKSNFKSLWLYNIQNKELKKINDKHGSGFDVVFNDETTQIKFSIDEFKNKKKYHIAKVYDISKDFEVDDSLVASIPNNAVGSKSSILISSSGESKILEPFGEGHYIWVSISPNKDKILFTFAGKGTFICDLEGRVLVNLGFANSPKWSPNGKYVAFMNDKDDGLNYISSDIYVVSEDGQNKINITNTVNEIEMYPEWSFDGRKIVYHNLSGEIFIAELEIQ